MFYFYCGTKLLKRNIFRQVVTIAYLSNYTLNKPPAPGRDIIWKEVSYLKFCIVYIRFLEIHSYCRTLIAFVFSFCCISFFSLINVILFLICNRRLGIPEWIFRNYGKTASLYCTRYIMYFFFLIWEVVK